MKRNNSLNASLKKRYKVRLKSLESQNKRFYNLLKHKTISCSMASSELDVWQKVLTRSKRKFERLNLLVVVKYDICEITGRRVQFLSTNPRIVKKSLTNKKSSL